MIDSKASPGIISVWSVSLLFCIVIVAQIVLIVSLGLDDHASLLVNDFFLPGESLLAMVAVWYGARRTSFRDRKLARAWYVITLAALCWFLGELSWTVIEVGLKQSPFPSVADVFYLLYYPLLIIGIVLIPRTPLKEVNKGEYLMLSGLLIGTVTFFFSFLLILPLFEIEYTSLPIFIFSVLYPIFDLILLDTMLALFLLMLKKQPSAPIWCLMISILLMTVTDSVFGIQEIKEIYTGGNLLDIGWSLGVAFMGLAGIFQGRDTVIAAER